MRVQALAPAVVTRSDDGLSREVPAARMWGAILTAIPAGLAHAADPCRALPRPDLVLVVGLLVFGFVFAVISSLHSYLILGLRRLGEGGRGRRLLLRGQCRRPADRHPAVGRA